MSSVEKGFPRYTVDDYLQWQGDWELWDGVAIAMTPSPFGKHQAISARLLTRIYSALEAAGCNATALTELDWIVSDETVVRPDLIVICGEAPEGHLRVAPAFVAEILSNSTRRTDLTFKKELYEREGVANYLVVDPQELLVRYFQLVDGQYEEVDELGKTLSLSICDECEITFSLDFRTGATG